MSRLAGVMEVSGELDLVFVHSLAWCRLASRKTTDDRTKEKEWRSPTCVLLPVYPPRCLFIYLTPHGPNKPRDTVQTAQNRLTGGDPPAHDRAKP